MAALTRRLKGTLERLSTPWMKALGFATLVLGILLIPVPLIPGWPFLALSGWCFSQLLKGTRAEMGLA